MKILFIVLSIIQTLYFLIKTRKTDLYTVAYFSAIIYFIPGFLGYTYYPGRVKVELDPRVYIVYIIIISFIWVAAVMKDLSLNKSLRHKPIKFKKTKYVSTILSIISLVLTIYYVVTLKSNLLEPKAILMPMLGPPFLILRYSVSIAFIMGFLEKNKKVLIITSSILVFTFFIGFRGPLALSILGLIIIYFSQKKSASLIKSHFKIIILLLIFGYSMVMGKIFYGTFKREGFFEAVLSLFNIELIEKAISSLESFITQAILNEVIVRDFWIGISHLKSIIFQLLIKPSLFIDESLSFNYLFQTQLFPDVTYGMAYNIWAEAVSSGGFLFLILIVSIFILGIYIFDKLCQSRHSLVRAFAGLSGVYWVFLIHRSSIDVVITRQRHIIYIVLGSMFLAYLVKILVEISKKKRY